MKIWKHYLLFEFLKIFFLLLGIFFFLFSLMDYSLHMNEFTKSEQHLGFSHIFAYYICVFAKRAEVIFPITFLVAVIKVLCTLTLKHEWLAFQASGISSKKLLSPFFSIAFLLTFLMLIHHEYLLPKALAFSETFQNTYIRLAKGKKKENHSVQALSLKDGTKLIYLHMDPLTQRFSDVYWILSPDEIWHAKYLDQTGDIPQGRYVDFIAKNQQGHFEKISSFEHYAFHGMNLKKILKNTAFIPIENRSISQLIYNIFYKEPSLKENENAIRAHLYYKIIISFTSLLAILGISSFCISYSRHPRIFLIYTLALSASIVFFVLMDALAILGESGILSPLIPMCLLPLLIGLFFSWRFAKI